MSFESPEADIEFTVTNIDETGPVTIDWDASSSVEGSGLELMIVGGGLLAIAPGGSTIPTDTATCVADQCIVSFTLAVETGPELDVQLDDPEGSVNRGAVGAAMS